MTLATFLLLFALVIIGARVGGVICERLGIPAVVGELVAGIVVGNISIFGFHVDLVQQLKTSEIFHTLSEVGVILLLFMVGLEGNLRQFVKTGRPALVVACAGVVAPFLLIILGWKFMPFDHGNIHQQIFLAATATATSVGITARVLKDLGRVGSTEGQIILGAAVIDDVLGLIILAVVSALIKQGQIDLMGVIWITAKAVLFLGGTALAGNLLLPRFIYISGRFDSGGLMGAIAFSMCFLCAWLADVVGLAPIVGAFAAGLILDDVHFKQFHDARSYSLEQLVKPVAELFVPVFFVLMGIGVNLSAFASLAIVKGALILTVLAVVGKLISGIFIKRPGIDKLAVGLGMIPRGEVGLIFAAIGSSLGVVDGNEYAMIVFMVLATTLITPPLLQWRLKNIPMPQKPL
ncbi:MAG: sodium:proton exchanger [Deltaproteobacteria bacterium CG11_big_fil_rev_8_21_14_0_20_47_16]|nr:MAG: sodium:proton exchanger [Deltaproteobacteria bacterium CG11_big_fil_rev_8_21_14_0_20_47_16]